MFDITKEIKLEKKISKAYGRLQKVLYLISVLFAIYFVYLVFFPSAFFSFDFANPNSQKNSVLNVRNSQNGFIEHGKIILDDTLAFDTALSGNFEKAEAQFVMDKQSVGPHDLKIETKKSYQAFLYSDGAAIGFKDGTLLNLGNIYYIVSSGKLRKFYDEKTIIKMGYAPSAFLGVSESDLKYNDIGETINNPSEYPDNTIFKINNEYYMLFGGKLQRFLSQKAYLSQYGEPAAIEKDLSIFEKYPVDSSQIGFSDGTLLSYGVSVYIVSSGKLLPINNTVTFTTMGYGWEDIKQASADEIGFYEKDKLFNISSAHPNGTILYARDINKSYLIENKTKRIMPTDAILKSWQRNKPIVVSSKSSETSVSCILKKEKLTFRTFSCDLSLADIRNFISNNYEFYLKADREIKIDRINITFKKQVNFDNLKGTARDLLNRIKINYGIGTTAQ
jgi:hypothetical protein